MKLTVFSLLVITIVFVFAGVEPLLSYKNKVISLIEQGWETITAYSQSPTSVAVKPPPASALPPIPTELPAPTSVAVKPPPASALPPIPTELPVLQREQLIQYALEIINKDRVENGLTSVSLGNNTAAQKHAEEMLANDYFSHWGMDGMKPYMRYTLDGGFNYEAENGFMTTTTWYGGTDPSYRRDPKEMLDEAERSLMGSPGHRRNILNKWHKKLNLGIAYDRERLFLVQQFEGDYIKFSQVPALENGILSATGETIGGFTIDGVQIWYDQPSHSLTVGQLNQTYAYNTGKPVAFLRQPAPPNSYYPENQSNYTWETQGIDPYSVSADILPSTPSTPGVVAVYPLLFNLATVPWVDAKRWDISGNSFAIEADLSAIVSKFGKGVYTVIIWGENGSESVELSNYSTFVK